MSWEGGLSWKVEILSGLRAIMNVPAPRCHACPPARHPSLPLLTAPTPCTSLIPCAVLRLSPTHTQPCKALLPQTSVRAPCAHCLPPRPLPQLASMLGHHYTCLVSASAPTINVTDLVRAAEAGMDVAAEREAASQLNRHRRWLPPILRG